MTEKTTIDEILAQPRTLAVIGAKDSGPAFYVPEYLQTEGFRVIPISPKGDTLWGEDVVKSVADVDIPVDVVVIFRRSEAVQDHVEEILEMSPQPSYVWMQLGIANESAKEAFEKAGMKVVMDHCLLVEHKRLAQNRT